MNRREVILKGSELNNILLNKPQEDGNISSLNSEFRFEWITSPNIAIERVKRLSGNPNYSRPVPFVMPSRKWNYSIYMMHENTATLGRLYQASEEEKFQATNPPTYLIKGSTVLGGTVGEYNALIENETIASDVYIKDTTFEETITIRYFLSKYNIHFTNCEFKNGVSLVNIEVDEIRFDNCIFNTGLGIYNCNLNTVTLNNISDIKTINISIDKIEEHRIPLYQNDIEHRIGKITLENVQVSDKLFVASKNIGSLHFRETTITNTVINLHQDKIDIHSEQQLTINKLDYNITPSSAATQSSLTNLYFKDIQITGNLGKDDTLTLQTCNCDNMVFENFSNSGKFVLNNISIKNSIKIINTDLAKMTFLGVNFTNTKRFDILHSNITDIILYQTTLPSIINESISNLEARREVYRQLKHGSNKLSDKVNELKYDAIEASIIRQLLEKNNNRDKWIFKLNDWTSRHGQDWWLAARVQFGLTLFTFCVIQLLMGFTKLNFKELDTNVGNLLLFANPIHKFSDIFGKQSITVLHIISMLLDAIYRLASGYMIFQFLRAFRKYFRS